MNKLQSYQDGVCKIGENKILHPLAYILHTHALGQVCKVCVRSRRLRSIDVKYPSIPIPLSIIYRIGHPLQREQILKQRAG